MRRLFLRLALVLLALVVIAVAAVYLLSARRLSQRFEVTAAAVAVPTDEAARIEGRRLYISRGCADCHDQDLGGKMVLDDFMAGTIAGPNLTTGAGGIGERSDLDLVRAIRHGVAPDGRGLIFMPAHEYNPFADAEIGAIIAAMRAAAPVDRASTPVRVGPLMRLLFLLGQVPVLPAELVPHAAPRPPAPEVAQTAAYGAYLANLCIGCHGPGLSGGAIPGVPPDWPAASNLTSDASTGLGGWGEADFIRAMREGTRRDGTAIDPVMPWRNFSKMTDLELRALWLHLSALPARPSGGR